MKKVRNLRFLGILGVSIAVLFLISISVTQAQVNIQGKGGTKGKPDKPPPEPEATWAVELPGVGNGEMLYGDGDRYENTAGEVIIKVEKGGSRVSVPGGGRRTVFFYYFSFKLVNKPTNRYVGFQGVKLTTVGESEDPYCIFPYGDVFTCMETFLNQNHPHPDYEYFNLKFQVGQFSFENSLLYPQGIEGIEDMEIGDRVKFTSNSDWIKIRVENQVDFTDPYTEFHNIECDERNYDDKDLTNMNIWITRMASDRWRISVEGADLLLQEQYTERSGKGKNKTVTVVPYEAKGKFTFYIDFIKITDQ